MQQLILQKITIFNACQNNINENRSRRMPPKFHTKRLWTIDANAQLDVANRGSQPSSSAYYVY